MAFSITRVRQGDIDILCFPPGSELTSVTAMPMITSVLKSVRAPYHVVLDCAGLAALDSAGLGSIVQLFRRIRELGGKLHIASVPKGYARNIFVITRLDTVFTLYEDVEAAVAAYAAP